MAEARKWYGTTTAEATSWDGTLPGNPEHPTNAVRRIELQQIGDFVTIKPGETRVTQRASVEGMVDFIMDRMYGQHCGKAVVACRHCGQWGARYCACKHCGAPVD